MHRPIAIALVACSVSVVLLLVAGADAEQQNHLLCAHRDDRTDNGAPVHTKRGGGKIQHRLPNEWPVWVLKTGGSWMFVQYTDPRPEAKARSEPRRFRGWMTKQSLRPCVLRMLGSSSEGGAVSNILSAGEIDPEIEKALEGVQGIDVASSPEPPVKLCWWTTQRLGHGKRDWKASARAIEGCDVVGLGEVVTRDAASKLASVLGPTWQAATAKVPVGTEGSKEHYAVIRDTKRVSAVTRTVEGSKATYPDPGDKLVREPWSVSLKAGNFDFTLVLMHIVSGENASERIAELQEVDDVYRYYRDRDPREQDVIIMGNFNRTPSQTGWELVRQLGLKLLIKGATTINTKGQVKSAYDQIIIDPRHTKEWTGKAGVITDVGMNTKLGILSKGIPDLVSFRKTVSDHLPVWASFETAGHDDD